MRPDDNDRRPLRLIVSGGLGSGKSTVVGMLVELGAVAIEADRIGHEVLAVGGGAFDAVATRWPSVVVRGEIDRRLLAAIVFTDADQLAELESISHPLIAAEIANRVAGAADKDVVLELPLASDLAGSGWTRILVDTPPDTRLRRAIARGMAAKDAASRIAVQPDRSQWIDGADIVIENAGTIDDLEETVAQLWATLHEPDRGSS